MIIRRPAQQQLRAFYMQQQSLLMGIIYMNDLNKKYIVEVEFCNPTTIPRNRL